MKLLKKMFLTLILPIIIVPTISLSPNSKRNDDDIKYKLNKKLFEPYYKRLGLENALKNNKFRIPEKYDKVGILETENFDHNSLISTNNKNFKFHNLSKTKENDKNKSLHAYSVSSIIGTDLGININAEIYFDSNLNTSNILDKIKNMKENFGVSIFNCSWGFSDLSDNITKHFENYISADVEQINNELLNKNEKELLILNQIALSFFYYIYNKNTKLQNLLNKNQYDLYKELDDYAAKNDVKLIFSSGNYNENNDNLKEIFNHSKKGNYISEFSFDSISSWLNKFLEKVSSNTKTNTKTNNTELYYKKEAKNIILLKKILKNHLIDNNLIINQNDFFNNDNRIWNIIEGSIKFQSTNSFPNLINIGAVDSLNYPTNFTSYSFINDDNSPLISSYGESLSDQYRNHIIYKVNKAKEKFLKNRSESSLDANEREKLDEVLAKVKEESIKETRASILLEFEKVNSSSDEKINFEHLAKFSGTSMAAPLVTGMISLLQSELKRELSLNEVKSILSSSSTYSSQKASNSYYSQKHLNSKEEIWRRNHSKNKTGFGIPKYFKMKKIIKNNLLTSLSNESLENWTSSNSIKSTQINIKKEFNNLSDTISLTVQKDFLEVVQEYKGNKIEEITRFINQHKKDEEEKRRSIKNKIKNKEVEYNNANNIDKFSSDIFSPGLTIDELEIAYNFKNDPINYYDLYSHVVLERVNKNDESTYNSTRMKSSNSKTSTVERNNFGNYKNVIKTKYNYELLLNQVIEIKEIIRTKLQETKEYKEIMKIKNINLKNKKIAEFQEKIEEYNNTLIDFYKEYIKKYWVFHSYLSINGE